MKGLDRLPLLLPVALVVCCVLPAGAGDPTGSEGRAHQLLRAMSDYLKSAEQLTFHSEVTYDSVTVNDQLIQYGGAAEVAVHRPDRIRVEYRSDEGNRAIVFNGRTLTMFDVSRRMFAQTEMKTNLDTALDRMFEKFGFSVPTADLVYANPYATLTENVDSGFVVGLHTVQGARCHHLAFSQESIDWQIWIEDGPRPLPRKLLITYKDEPGSPQWTVVLSRWDLSPRISDTYFEFHPPAGVDRIDFLPAEEGEGAP